MQRRGVRPAGVLTVVFALLLASAFATSARADAVRQRQWYLSALNITKAWSLARGDGVKVGVLDSGIDGKNVQDLRGAVIGGKNFSGVGSADGETALDSHGTEVASVLAGRGHGPGHSAGVIGSAPAASLVSAVGPAAANYSVLAAAIRWLVDQGVKVLNISQTFYDHGTATKSAIAYAEAHDVVVVASAGNSPVGNQVDLPGGYPGVVAERERLK